MSTIQAVLKEEYERLQKLLGRYEKKIVKLPVGSVSIKTRNGRESLYRSYRKNEKVKKQNISVYRILIMQKKIKELIDKRRELETLLKTTKLRIN